LATSERHSGASSPTVTIAAIATAAGQGGIGIVRVSGPQASSIATQIVDRSLLPGVFRYTAFHAADQHVIDVGVALFFRAPHSYTGEDVLELQGHGGTAVMQLLLQRVLDCGARLARPGEFTERAFLNDRIDLAQAEAVADLIESASTEAARAAMRSLSGEFSDRVRALVQQLIELRVYIEAALDFAEEEIDFLSGGELESRVDALQHAFATLMANLQQGRLLKEGLTVVLAGRPNVGKSSLLNRLTGTDSAIVTDIAGTTRDVLREQIYLDGMPLNIVDTAGLSDSGDRVEREGVRRARRAMADADRILWVRDGSLSDEESLPDDVPAGLPLDIIVNKCDVTATPPSISEDKRGCVVHLAAKTGAGISLLIRHLQDSAGFRQNPEGVFLARQRHVDALERAAAATDQALQQLQDRHMPELAAEDLRVAQQALNEITGEFTSDDLLGRIFSSFCIGK